MALKNSIKLYLRGLFGVHDGATVDGAAVDIEAEVSRCFQHTAEYGYPDDGGATTNIDAKYFWTAEANCKVLNATVLSGALTADNTNYATLNLQKANGGGGSLSTIATAATTATNVAAGVPYDLTISSANINTGEVLAFNVIKSGAGGLDMAAGVCVVRLEER